MLRSTYLVNKTVVWKLEINWTMAPEIWHAYSSISCPTIDCQIAFDF